MKKKPEEKKTRLRLTPKEHEETRICERILRTTSPCALPPTPTKRKNNNNKKKRGDALTISCMAELFVRTKRVAKTAAEGTTSAGEGTERCWSEFSA